MKKTIPFTISLFCAALLTAAGGCKSEKMSHYVAPRVAGRVLAADTGLPLADARVQRMRPVETTGEATAPKGSQLLTQPGPQRTDAEGRFVLQSENVVTPFHHRGWQAVTVVFECPGYERLQTNFTTAKFKETSPSGEPLVNCGDICLRPVKH